MSYKLTFLDSAKKEWSKLDANIQKQFKNKLTERLAEPRIPKAQLAGMPDCYKIKLKAVGYRLVYKIFATRLVVQVIAIGKRNDHAVYNMATKRLN